MSAPASSKALELLGSLRLEDGRSWAEAATPWQVADARAILGDDGPRLHYLTRPRGASKTSDLAAVSIAVLLEQLPAGSRAYAVATDRDQGRLLVDAAHGFATRTPGLAGALSIDTWRITATRTGSTLDVLAADGPSTYGLRPSFVVVDELSMWPATPGPRQVWEAIISAIPKVAGCRCVVLTSAGAPEHWSYKVLEQAIDSPRWRVHEVPGPCPWLDPEDLAEQEQLLTESQYARLHLNRWTAGEDRLANLDAIRECVRHEGPLDHVAGNRYVIGLDVGLKRDATAAVVAHAERIDDDPKRVRIVVDRVGVWKGTPAAPVSLEEVEAWLERTAREYDSARIVFDPWQSALLAERLKRKGLRTKEYQFTASSVGALGKSLYQLIRDRLLALPDDEGLLDELANVRLRETSPGVFRLDHDPGRHDDQAIALALASHTLLEEVRDRPTDYRIHVIKIGGDPEPGDADGPLSRRQWAALWASERTVDPWEAHRRRQAAEASAPPPTEAPGPRTK